MASAKEATTAVKWFVIDQIGDEFRGADSILLKAAPDIKRLLGDLPFEKLLITKNQGLKFAARGEVINKVIKLLGPINADYLGGSARLREANTPISETTKERLEMNRRSVTFKGLCRQMSPVAFVEALKVENIAAVSGSWLSPADHQSGVMKVTLRDEEEVHRVLSNPANICGMNVECAKFVDIRRPTQCFNCWKFGHIAEICKEQKVCKKCAKRHSHRDCKITGHQAQGKCTNCKGNHAATFTGCPVYTSELEKLAPKKPYRNFVPASAPNQNPWKQSVSSCGVNESNSVVANEPGFANVGKNQPASQPDDPIKSLTMKMVEALAIKVINSDLSCREIDTAVSNMLGKNQVDQELLSLLVLKIKTVKGFEEELETIRRERTLRSAKAKRGRTAGKPSPNSTGPTDKQRCSSLSSATEVPQAVFTDLTKDDN